MDYNPGIVAAFQSAYGDKVTVSPVFSVSGAYGASLLAYESVGIKIGNSGKPEKESSFLGFDFPSKEVKKQDMTEEIRKNKELYKMAGQFSMRGYDATIDPDRKTIGIPMVLVMFKFFTLANEFFRDLGYNVVMSHVSNEETIQLSQQYAQGETCYPVKLVYGAYDAAGTAEGGLYLSPKYPYNPPSTCTRGTQLCLPVYADGCKIHL